MTVTEQVRTDMTSAMKAGEKQRVGALRLVLSELQKAAKEGSDDELAVRIAGDDEVEAVGTQIDGRQHVGHGAGGSTHAGFRPW